MKLQRADQDFILIHVFWGFLAAFCLQATSLPPGWRIFIIVAGYHIILPLFARQVKYNGWLQLWQFTSILSLLQILPDLYLSRVLGILSFPETGSPTIGGVPLFMGGLWAIPLFIIVYLGRRFKGPAAFWIVSSASALIFIAAESILWQMPIWQAVNVTQIAHVALYVILPEILLGITSLRAFEWSLNRAIHIKIAAAFFVSAAYFVNLNLCYFLVEKIIFGN